SAHAAWRNPCEGGASMLPLLVVFLQAAPAEPPPQRVLRLNDAVEAGLKNQPTVRQAKAQTRVFEARTDEAKAPLFPQLTTFASDQRVRGAVRGSTVTTPAGGAGTGAGTGGGTGTTTVGGNDPAGTNVFSVGANASQLIWDFGQTYRKYEAADRLTDAAK